MRQIVVQSNTFDNKLLAEGLLYTVGTNDGMMFKDVIYVGTEQYNGKPMMVFKTNENNRLTVNPSYHTFTLEQSEKDIEDEEHTSIVTKKEKELKWEN